MTEHLSFLHSAPFKKPRFSGFDHLPDTEGKRLFLALQKEDEEMRADKYPNLLSLLQRLEESLILFPPKEDVDYKEDFQSFRFTHAEQYKLEQIKAEMTRENNFMNRRDSMHQLFTGALLATAIANGGMATHSRRKNEKALKIVDDLHSAAREKERCAKNPEVGALEQKELMVSANKLRTEANHAVALAAEENQKAIDHSVHSGIATGLALITFLKYPPGHHTKKRDVYIANNGESLAAAEERIGRISEGDIVGHMCKIYSKRLNEIIDAQEQQYSASKAI